MVRLILNCVVLCLVDQAYNAIKAQSKTALDKSKEVLREATPELRAEYHVIEEARVQYERDLAVAERDELSPPSTEGIDLRTLDELQSDLETQQANLDLNLATNPGVVEQYEKRKRDVGGCWCLREVVLIVSVVSADCTVGEDDRGKAAEG